MMNLRALALTAHSRWWRQRGQAPFVQRPTLRVGARLRAAARQTEPVPIAKCLLLFVGGLFLLGPLGRPAVAQVGPVPTPIYFGTFGIFYEGDYKRALQAFQSESRTAIKTTQSNWIDSICYHTMIGECYFHMGELPSAMEHYNASLKLFVAYQNWMMNVRFSPGIRPASNGGIRRVPWGASSRNVPVGSFPPTTLMSQGQIDNTTAYTQPGLNIATPAMLFPVNVQEIVRCTVLAIRRRALLLGPASPSDPLTNEVLAALSRRPGPPNHWSEAWIDVQLGVAMEAAGKNLQAEQALQRALVAGGQFDHPLTSSALLELGRLSLAKGNYPMAAKYFDEATYAAVNTYSPGAMPDLGVLEEAFRFGAITHFIANQKGFFAPLAPGVLWAKREHCRQFCASLQILGAENYLILNQSRDAAVAVDDARHTIANHDMAFGGMGARVNYVAATVAYQQKRVADGDTALASAMKYMHGGSLRLFQISLVDNLYTSGGLTDRVAMDLYNVVLSDPQRIDWAAEPMESMASMVMPHGLPIEHWFEAAWNRKQYDVALEIADRARRHRFLCSLPLGGRVQILRWLLSAPDLILPQQARLDRQDILARYPAYEQLAKQAADIEVKLRAQPPVAAAEATREQKDLVAQLAVVSQQQDTLLREIAMRREPAEILFPPLRTAKFIRDHLPDGHALLVFYATSRHLYGFLANNQQYSNWQIGPPQPLNKRLADLLRQMGQFEQNHELTVKEVADDQWKAAAHSFLDALLKGSRADFSQPLEELIIVPDGVLWYVPFEALQVDVGGKTRALLSRFRIRYVPLATLAIPDGRNRKPAAQTAVAVGPLYTRDSEATGRVAADEIAKVLPGTVLLPNPMPAPGASYLSVFDRLIVLDQIAPGDQAPYGWTPVPSDRGKVGDSLDDWLALPWQKPEELVLPGFHTAAENAMKRVHAGGAGQELFLEVCGMMASGARTILLSRWRTGGRSAYDLTREFVQELPHTSAADAWQRAVFLLASTRLTLEAEPRVKHATNDEAPKVTHPFFWAGYMLVDSAGSAQAEEAAKQEVVKIRQPDAKPAPAAPQPDANPARKPGAKTR